MTKLPNLIWLRSFEAAARHLNFTTAAGELGLTQTALSLHIRSLEADLGCQLFTRAARRLTLTEIGQAYAVTVRRALGEIALSTGSLFGPGSGQALTVRVPISTATLWLASRLPKFARLHPGIAIRLVSNIWADSAASDVVDVELRLGTGDWPDLACRKVSQERIVPVSAADAPHLDAGALSRAARIEILGFEDMWHRFLTAHGVETSRGPADFTVDTTVAALDIVAAGGGHAVVLERFAKTAIAMGKPIVISGDPVPIAQAHYLIGTTRTGPDDTASQLFEQWLISELASED